MTEFIENNKKYVLLLALLFVFVSLSGTTYSLFVNVDSTNTFTYSTGNLELEFTEDEEISLASAFPIIDSEAIKSDPYVLTIKNTGTLSYLFDLKMLSNVEDNMIDSKYIKYKVNDEKPTTLYKSNGIVASNIILNAGESITFKINVWLDYYTPNLELGKTFTAKLVTTGESIYKTLDNSTANSPNILDNMIPVYYDNGWKIADKSNTIESYEWYDYSESKWANSVIIKDSEKKIYDITGNHDITISDIKYNDENIIIDDKFLDLGISNYSNNNISGIFRVRFDNLEESNYYILSNNNFNYYYNNEVKKFIFEINGNKVESSTFFVEEGKWYIFGFTYNERELCLYADGFLMNSFSIMGNINSDSSFKVGVDSSLNDISSFSIGNIYLYNDILANDEIENNYSTTINLIYDGLYAGYDLFIPMNKYEYYINSSEGTTISSDDIDMQYVWIPRFKYKLWNVTGDNSDSYDAKNNGIDISFEKGIEKTGTIYCDKYECYTDSLLITKVTNKDNDKYYTHPAFTKGDEELEGIWISKYEYGNDKDINNLYSEVTTNNKYIIKNIEWGAMLYLSHSKYGICIDSKCDDYELDSTTGNIYGVLDVNSGNTEIMLSGYNISLINNIKLNDSEYDNYIDNVFILGDATKEINNWYEDNSNFVDSTNNYFVRGGINSTDTNMFYYNATTGVANKNIATRIVIR